MNLSFVGMSGSGKSVLANRLQCELGFKNYSVDDLIVQELHTELPENSDIHSVANWLAEPGTPSHLERETKYLALENRTLKQICEIVEQNSHHKIALDDVNKNIVVDTTGSVVYLPQKTLDRLRELTVVVYLRVDKADLSLMIERYFSDPKPVIWGEIFSTNVSENTNDAIRRCYPKLLAERAAKYEKLAHHIFDVRVQELSNLSLDKLLTAAKGV